MRTRRLELMRPAEIVAAREAAPVVYLPFGPLEWHGPHLPLGVDGLVSHAAALLAAERTGGVVMPPLYMGTDMVRTATMLRTLGFEGDEHIVGMDFPANTVRSVYLDEGVFLSALRHLIELLADRSWRVIALASGHGGVNQVARLRRLAPELTAATGARVLYCQAWLEPDGLPEGQSGGGHSDATETSLIMHLLPEAVDLGALPPPDQPLRNVDWAIVDGPTFEGRPNDSRTVQADPRVLASPEAGAAALDAIASSIAHSVAQALREVTGQ